MDSSILKVLTANHDATTLVLLGAALTIASVIVSKAAQWFRLRHVPGPFIASITSLWAYRSVSGMQFHNILKQVQDKYGKIVRIAPNDVLVSDPDVLWYINSARSAYTRGDWYGSVRFNPYGDSVFSEMDTKKHDKRKAKLATGFLGKGLVDIESSVNTHLAVLTDILRDEIKQGEGQAVLDIGRILQYFQVDLITGAGMGKPWGNLTSNKDSFGYLAAGDKLFPFVHSIAMVPFLRFICFSPAFLWIFGSSTTTGWLGELSAAVQQRVKKGVENDSGRDMLSEWLKHGLTPAEAELDLSIQVPAGTETSISTIRGILMHLMTSPRIYYKLKKEISEGIKEGRISSPITNEEAKKLPYLQAVINEGMRICPPLTAGFPKKVPPGGDVICGKALPPGTEVHVNLISMMRDREIFGQDPEIFLPERFIDCDDITKTKRTKVVDLNFGHGRWLCLGRVLALMELNKIFVELLRSFDFQIADPENPWARESTVSMFIRGFVARVTEDPIV